MLLTIRLKQRMLTIVASAALGILLPGAVPGGSSAVSYLIPEEVRQLLLRLHLVGLPSRMRERNWLGSSGQGSCVHAAMVHLFRWQGRHAQAQWWRQRFGDGETPDGLTAKLTAAGIPFAETRAGDAAFLDWALRTRRGAAVVVQNGAHMVTLAGLDRREARILDSNHPQQIQGLSREQFLDEWRRSGGWAVTPLGTPPPPDPWLVKSATIAH